MKAVFHPFPDVAIQVVQSKGVGLFGCDRAGRFAAVGDVPDLVVQRSRVVGDGRVGGAAAPGGVFPFGLGRQPVALSGFQVEFADELRDVFPAHVLDRAVQATGYKAAGVVAHDRFPLPLGHFRLADGEAGHVDDDRGHGFGVRHFIEFHGQAATGQQHHVGALCAVFDGQGGR